MSALESFEQDHIGSNESVAPEQITAPQRKKQRKPNGEKSCLMYLHDLVYLLAAIVVVFLLCFRVVVVSGTSMNNTLMDGDYVLLLDDAFCGGFRYGDIVVASKESFEDGEPIIKRVIAVEGQWVDIDFDAGIVYVGEDADHMQALDEPYTLTDTNLFEGIDFPLQVESGCLFVMGDNRNKSKDSRNPQIGQIDEREVMGKVLFLFFPGTNEGENSRDFGRIGVVS